MRRTVGRLAQALGLAVGAIGVIRAGSSLAIARAAERPAFLRLPPVRAVASRPHQALADTSQVQRLLEAARGANVLVCSLAARTVDGRSGWWGGDGAFVAGSSPDSLDRELVMWVHRQGDVGAESVPLLRAALGDPDWCVRRLAAPLLGRVHDPAAMQAMLAALAGSDAGAREMAALALGFADDARAVSPLVAHLRDDAPRVRATAAWALGEIESRDAVRPLIEGLGDTDAMVRESAASALGEIEDSAAIVPLTDVLKSDRSAAVRRAAARALGEIAG